MRDFGLPCLGQVLVKQIKDTNASAAEADSPTSTSRLY